MGVGAITQSENTGEHYDADLEPAANDLILFCRAYQSLGDPVQVEEVCKFFEQLLWQANKENQIVLPLWMTLSRAYKQIEKNDKALVCARQACKCDVNAYEARLLMASVLFELSAYSEAEQHLRWCVSRRPEHELARSLLKKIVMKKCHRQRRPQYRQTERRRADSRVWHTSQQSYQCYRIRIALLEIKRSRYTLKSPAHIRPRRIQG